MTYEETGDALVCIHAASRFYTVGETYLTYKGEDNYTYIQADDGLYDLKSLVISAFKECFAPRDPENLDPYGAQNHPLPPMEET